MKKLQQLREERADKIAASSALFEKAAKDGNRSLNDEEKAQIRTIQAEIKALDSDIEFAEIDENQQRELAGRQPANTHSTQQVRDLNSYSLLKAVRSVMPGGAPLEGIEKEMHQQAVAEARAAGESVQGVGIPQMLLSKRDNSITMPTQPEDGSAVVDKTLRPVIDLLRPKTVLRELGATFLTGLVGNIGIPTMATGAVSAWHQEVEELTKSNQKFSSAEMKPHRLGTYALRSKQFLLQTSAAVEQMLRSDLENSIMQALEIAALNGSGTNNQPTGILNTAGVNAVALGGANGAAPTRELLVTLAAAVEAQNVQLTNPGYLLNVATKAKLMNTKVDAGSGQFLLDSNSELMGYPMAVTQNAPGNLTKGTSNGNVSAAVFGNWSDLLIGQWGGLDITVDPYTLATNGQIRIIIQSFFDVLVQRPNAFAVAKDVLTA